MLILMGLTYLGYARGIAKHNGPIKEPIPFALRQYNAVQSLRLNSFASAEAQVAAISDDIAYNSHDLHDGLRAKLFTMMI